ncbi:MAG: 16S rRNA (guanine(966)-N(2))-methyltransferase RsmD [Clostridia bacterium]|nr:16S rRNA (guanine(966)-N(2))-methyltransferase RsmD [Clostridia bacterium]MCR5694512.1 16S rRNA (guanine(966)-N(2))-methyltransferase RsmD [Clostridia bacterium]
MVRVIAGTCRGRKLKTLDSEATKPTLDRVKEAMFSMIAGLIPGAVVLDLFSGNGSLGIEALSRGAEKCFFCDISADCCRMIRENLSATGFDACSEVIKGDFSEAIAAVGNRKIQADLLLLDPPYRKGLIGKALTDGRLQKLCRRGDDGSFPPKKTVAVCEHAREEELPDGIGNFRKIKTKSYGTVSVTLYEFCGE